METAALRESRARAGQLQHRHSLWVCPCVGDKTVRFHGAPEAVAAMASQPSTQSRVMFQVGEKTEEPAHRKLGKLTVKYNRKDLQRRLDIEEWIDGQLHLLFDCEVGARAASHRHTRRRQPGEGLLGSYVPGMVCPSCVRDYSTLKKRTIKKASMWEACSGFHSLSGCIIKQIAITSAWCATWCSPSRKIK